MSDRNSFGRRPIDADELGDGDWRELDDALKTGRALDASIDDVPVRVSSDFTSRVMAAVSREPAPGTVGFMAPLRRRGIVAGFADSVRQAWAAIGAPGLPSFARATALAYVLVVAMAGVALAGAATVGVGSALGILGPAATQTNAPSPSRAPDASTPTVGPETAPAETDEAGGTEGPSDGPDASDDHGGSSQEPGDDHGASSGPGSTDGSDDHSGPSPTSTSGSGSDDGSGSSSGSGSGETATPRPSNTPRPTGTPKPSETPH